MTGSTGHFPPPPAHLRSAEEANGMEASSLVPCEKQSTYVRTGQHHTLILDSSNISKLNVCSNAETKITISNVMNNANINTLVSVPHKELLDPLGIWSTEQETKKGSSGDVQNTHLHSLFTEETNRIKMDSFFSFKNQMPNGLTGDEQRCRESPHTRDLNLFQQSYHGLAIVVTSIPKWFGKCPLDSGIGLKNAFLVILIAFLLTNVAPVSATPLINRSIRDVEDSSHTAQTTTTALEGLALVSKGIKMCKDVFTIQSVLEMPLTFRDGSLVGDLCKLDGIVTKANMTTCTGNFSVYFNNKSSITYIYPENGFHSVYIEYGEDGKGAGKKLDLSNTDCEEIPDNNLETGRPMNETDVEEIPDNDPETSRPTNETGLSTIEIVLIAVFVPIGLIGLIVLPAFLYCKKRNQRERKMQDSNARCSVRFKRVGSAENREPKALNNGTLDLENNCEGNDVQLLGNELNGDCTGHMDQDDNLTSNGHALHPPTPHDVD